MTQLGGFGFDVTADGSGAVGSFEAVRLAGRRTVADINAAFKTVNLAIDPTGADRVTAAVSRLNAEADKLAAKGQLRVAVRADLNNAEVGLVRITQLAQRLDENAVINLRIDLAEAGAATNLDKIRLSLNQIKAGERINISIAGNYPEASKALEQLSADLEHARGRGVLLSVNVDTKAAEQKIEELIKGSTRITIRADVGGDADRGLAQLTNSVQRLQAASNVNLTANLRDDKALASITQIQDAVNRLRANDNLTINIGGTADQIRAALASAESAISAAEARGAHITMQLDTTKATAELSNFNKLLQGATRGAIAGSGLGGDLLIGAGIGGGAALALGAAVAVQKLTEATVGGVQAGIAYNSMLQQATTTFEVFTGSAEQANAIVADLRKNADITPFSTKEVIEAGQIFIKVARGNRDEMNELIKQAEALAAINPSQGLEGAARALQELNSGQTTSIAARFNVSLSALDALKQQGLTGIALIRAAVKEAGGSFELVDRLGASFEGRLSTAISAFEEFGRRLTAPIFDALSGQLEKLNAELAKNGQSWGDMAESVGQAIVRIGQALAFLGDATIGPVIRVTQALVDLQKLLDEAESRNPLSQPFKDQIAEIDARNGLTPGQLPAAAGGVQNVPTAIRPQTQEDQNRKALEETQLQLKNIETQLKNDEQAAAEITHEYQRAIAPLEAQLAVINSLHLAEQQALQREAAGNAETQANLAIRREAALPPPEVRGQVAASEAALAIDERRLEIQHRAQDQSRAISDARISIANQVAEAEIRAAERALAAEQRAVALTQRDRQDRITDIREEQQAAGLARQIEIEGIREVQQTRREQHSEDIAAIREAQRAAEERWQNEQLAADRAHQFVQNSYRDQIEFLQERNRIANLDTGPTRNERRLDALNEAERDRSARLSLAQAEAAVDNARTGRERRQAQAALKELEHQQEVDRKRQELEDKIERQREQADRQRQAREEQIRQLEVKARDDDRRYQAERQRQEDVHRIQQQQLANQNRAEDQAEHRRERQEDLAARAEEKADRTAERQEAAALREAEKADRLATRAENDAIQAKQLELESTRNALADAAAARQLEADQAHLARLLEQKPIEDAHIENLKALLAAENTEETIRLAREQALADAADTHNKNAQARLDAIKAGAELDTKQRIEELKSAEELRLVPVNAIRDATLATEDSLKRILATLTGKKPDYPLQGPPIPLPEGVEGPPVPLGIRTGETPPDQGDTGAGSIGQAVTDAFQFPDFEVLANNAIDSFVGVFQKGSPQLYSAIHDWIANGATKAVIDVLQTGSPSQFMIDQAGFFRQGFLDGYGDGADVYAAIRLPFEQARDWLDPYFSGVMSADGGLAATSWVNAWNQVDVYNAGIAPFDNILIWLAGLPVQMSGHGNAAGVSWINGYNASGILTAGTTPFQQIIASFPSMYADFEQGGANAAQSLANGWVQKNLSQLLVNDVNQVALRMDNLSESFRIVGSNLAIDFINGFNDAIRQWNPFKDQVIQQTAAEAPLALFARGGRIGPGERGLVGDQGLEIAVGLPGGGAEIIPVNNGSVPTGDVLPSAALSSFAQPGIGAAGATAPVSSNTRVFQMSGDLIVQLTTTGADAASIASEVGPQLVEFMWRSFEDGLNQEANPVSRILAGAD